MNKKCEEIMTLDPICCSPKDTVQRVAQIMKEYNVGAVPVCEMPASKMLLGLVTDRDLALRIVSEGRDPAATLAAEIMTTELFTCRPADTVDLAIALMEQQQVRRVPIVDHNNHIVGIIAQADLATRLREPGKFAELITEISRPDVVVRQAPR